RPKTTIRAASRPRSDVPNPHLPLAAWRGPHQPEAPARGHPPKRQRGDTPSPRLRFGLVSEGVKPPRNRKQPSRNGFRTRPGRTPLLPENLTSPRRIRNVRPVPPCACQSAADIAVIPPAGI